MKFFDIDCLLFFDTLRFVFLIFTICISYHYLVYLFIYVFDALRFLFLIFAICVLFSLQLLFSVGSVILCLLLLLLLQVSVKLAKPETLSL